MPKVPKEYLEKQKNNILDAALHVFLQKGFELATMTDVVEASGFSRGGVYRYFSSTEEMMHAILERDLDAGNEYIMNLINEYNNMWDALNRYIEEVEKNIDTSSKVGMMIYEYFITGWRNETRKVYLQKRYQRGHASLVRLFEKGVKCGDFKPTQSIETIASFIMNVFDGLYLEANLTDDDTINVKGQLSAVRYYLKNTLQIT
ncbi:TetR family transcriptional regulator [Sporolactobacillus spathodeae]|uniref:AcrR family transcriptional regulator n=1 Tax=Sporolactobacillus spathodeae TaxID=1465502 RepID=A0ABS2QCJ4_9BACL|nr:TetR family transcriptional regulator [Sporolactobacillus spathodeae]MBM7658662.1 AcrR family transcriptional regulator [Sporolactobacillus spathodeae]